MEVKAWAAGKLADALERVGAALESEGDREVGKEFLQGVYAPVEGDVQGPVQVVGCLPEEVRGHFLRVGPNPALEVDGAYHIFDGDGMIHVVRLDGEKSSYSRHQIETKKLATERSAGRALYPRIGGMVGLAGLARTVAFELRVKGGAAPRGSTANTALVHHANRLLALNESDTPYELELEGGRARTVGALDVARLSPFTAHPKVDPVTKCMHAFGYNVQQQPFLRYYVLDATGTLVHELKIDLPKPIMMHDFAMTENFVIFLDLSLAFDPKVMLSGQKRLPFVFDSAKPARIGVMRKMETDPANIKWLATDPHQIFHVMNAWEEGPELLKMVACRMDYFELSLDSFKGVLPDAERGNLCSYTLDLAQGSCSCKRILCTPPMALDFPVVAPHLVGRKTRFGFVAAFAPEMPLASVRCYKVDLEHPGEASFVSFGPERFGGECIFVPRREGSRGEDDGFLVALIWDAAQKQSECVVWDAFTMADDPVARVLLPQRVPLGFHSLFVPDQPPLSRL